MIDSSDGDITSSHVREKVAYARRKPRDQNLDRWVRNGLSKEGANSMISPGWGCWVEMTS